MASAKPVIVVVHATSKQGTSVVNSLLQTRQFAVKALVRDETTENAKHLAGKGAEVMAVDAMNAAQLAAAFEGAYGVFFVTVPYVIFAGKEFEHGQLVADTAAAAGVKVFVFSTLEDVEKRSKGKYVVQTFTDKARIEEYIKEKHGDMIGVFPAIAGFYTNWGLLNALRKDENGVLVFALAARGDLPRAWVNPYTAMGPVAVAAFQEPKRYRDRFIPVYDQYMSCEDMVRDFTKVTGIKARFQQLSKEDMTAVMPPTYVDVLWPMYRYVEEFGYYAPDRDMELVHRINPHPVTWVDYLRTSGFDGTQSEPDIRAKFA